MNLCSLSLYHHFSTLVLSSALAGCCVALLRLKVAADVSGRWWRMIASYSKIYSILQYLYALQHFTAFYSIYSILQHCTAFYSICTLLQHFTAFYSNLQYLYVLTAVYSICSSLQHFTAFYSICTYILAAVGGKLEVGTCVRLSI
jgi:hypothetical protein